MRTYGLYIESGPKRRKTMVHVIELLGCIANGPTTEDALEAIPDAIRTYLRFLKRHGEDASPDEPFDTTIVEHITKGMWLGNGSPYIIYEPDFAPVARMTSTSSSAASTPCGTSSLPGLRSRMTRR